MLTEANDKCIYKKLNIRNSIKCPLCRASVVIPKGKAEKLEDHLLMKQLQDVLGETHLNNELSTHSEFFCDLCQKENAQMYCRDCKIYVCLQCSKKHKKRKMFKSHIVFPRGAIVCSKCPIQPKKAGYLCTSCNTFLCTTCVTNGICDSHSITLLHDAEESKRNELDNLKDEIEECIEYAQQYAQSHDALIVKKIHEIKVYMERTDKRCWELTHQIQKIGSTITTQMKNYEREEMKKTQETVDGIIALQVQLKSDYNIKRLKELKQSVLEAKMENLEQMIVSISMIKSHLPTSSSVNLKEQIHAMSIPGAISRTLEIMEETAIAFEDSFISETGCSVPQHAATSILWTYYKIEKGKDIAFTKDGYLAIIDHITNQKKKKTNPTVLLFTFDNSEPSLLSTSTESKIHFERPVGISYHENEDALLVSDCTLGLVKVLTIELSRLFGTLKVYLHHKRSISLQDTPNPFGIVAMHNGNLAISQVFPEAKIGIYDESGRMLNSWNTYGKKDEMALSEARSITVDCHDNIYVSMCTLRRHIAVFSAYGQFLKTIKISDGLPKGISANDSGRVLVVAYPSQVYMLPYKPRGGISIKVSVCDRSKEAEKETGLIKSLSIYGNKMAILHSDCLHLYGTQQSK